MTARDRKTGREKRKFPRLEAKYLISYEYFDEELTEDIEGMGLSQNLSVGGVLITIDNKVRPGATLFLEMALKNNVIKATGRIAHVIKTDDGRYDVGVSFTQIKPIDQDLLNDFYQEKGVSLDLPK